MRNEENEIDIGGNRLQLRLEPIKLCRPDFAGVVQDQEITVRVTGGIPGRVRTVWNPRKTRVKILQSFGAVFAAEGPIELVIPEGGENRNLRIAQRFGFGIVNAPIVVVGTVEREIARNDK